MRMICPGCSLILREGDIVKATITTMYHELRSTKTYALDKDLTCDGDLRHSDCQYPQSGEGGDE